MPGGRQKCSPEFHRVASGEVLFERTKLLPRPKEGEETISISLPGERFRVYNADNTPTPSTLMNSGYDVARVGQGALFEAIDRQPDVSVKEARKLFRKLGSSIIYSWYQMPKTGLYVSVGSRERIVLNPDFASTHFASEWRIGFHEDNGD